MIVWVFKTCNIFGSKSAKIQKICSLNISKIFCDGGHSKESKSNYSFFFQFYYAQKTLFWMCLGQILLFFIALFFLSFNVRVVFHYYFLLVSYSFNEGLNKIT